jgi:hypothetical protein
MGLVQCLGPIVSTGMLHWSGQPGIPYSGKRICCMSNLASKVLHPKYLDLLAY